VRPAGRGRRRRLRGRGRVRDGGRRRPVRRGARWAGRRVMRGRRPAEPSRKPPVRTGRALPGAGPHKQADQATARNPLPANHPDPTPNLDSAQARSAPPALSSCR
jgi:hypothetical protein